MLNAMKRRIAQSMARRGLVQAMVRDRLNDDRDYLDAMRQRFRGELLEAGQIRPERVDELLNDPGIFRALLARLATNAEALYQMLRRAPFRQQLAAQPEFLRSLAHDRGVLAALLREVPAEGRADALQALLQDELGNLDTTAASGPEGLAAVLSLSQTPADQDPAQADRDRATMRLLANFLGSRRAEFVAAMTRNDPRLADALLADTAAAEQVLQALSADAGYLGRAMELAMVQPAHGATVSGRLLAILERLTAMPAFRAALARDPAIAEHLAALLRDAEDARATRPDRSA